MELSQSGLHVWEESPTVVASGAHTRMLTRLTEAQAQFSDKHSHYTATVTGSETGAGRLHHMTLLRLQNSQFKFSADFNII